MTTRPLKILQSALLVGAVSLLLACGGSSGTTTSLPLPEPDTRPFALGFTPWPYEASTTAASFVYTEAASRGDFIAHHLDGGIPWDEALNGTPYSANLETELNTRLDNTPAGMRHYLALSPLNGRRDGLAGYWGDAPNGALPPPWDRRAINDPNVITAYTNYAADLLERFSPDYFNLGIEASELALNDSAAYDDLVEFTAAVSAELKRRFPNVQLMISVALKSPSSSDAATIRAELPRLVEHIDVLGISVYPYIFFEHADRGDPANLPADWLSQAAELAGGKPIAVAETGWAAETVTIPEFAVDIASDAAKQAAYLDTLFESAESLDARFIVWFFLADYDTLWNDTLQRDPVARIWRDTGLYDEDLNPRPALNRWTSELRLPLE